MDPRLFGPPPEVGNAWSGVIDAIRFGNDTTEALMLPHGAEFKIVGWSLAPGRYTVYGMTVVSSFLLVLSPTTQATWFLAPKDSGGLPSKLIELAVGFGGMGIGASFFGARPLVSIDNCKLCVDHLRANHHGEILQLDLHDPSTPRLVHERCHGVELLGTFGFPCQPYSRQGLRREFNDARALTLTSGLRLLWLLQVKSAVLECVPQAGSNPEVRDLIQKISWAFNWDILELTFDLASQWGSARNRWWIILLPKSWNSVGISSWPFDVSSQSIGSIIGGWGTWDEAAESDLQLTADELVAHNRIDYGNDKRMMSLHDQTACILHSYSNTLRGCPCLCRSSGFSPTNLQQRGLRGFCAPSQVHGNPRFFHPRELAAVLGIPNSVRYIHHPRASNSLLGLVASPMQMVWIFATLKHNFEVANGINSGKVPLDYLKAYKAEILHQLRSSFPSTASTPGYISLITPEGDALHVVSFSSATVGELLAAHRIQLSWGHKLQLCSADGIRLPDELPLHGPGPYLLEELPKKMRRETPEGVVAIGILHRGSLAFTFLEPGQFLFEALRNLNIHSVNFLRDSGGRIYGADFRAWRSFDLETIENEYYRVNPLICAGLAPSFTEGLSEHTIWRGLQCIAVNTDDMLLLHPRQCMAVLQGDVSFSLPVIPELSSILGIFPADGHWALIHGAIDGNGVHWTYWDGLPKHLWTKALRLCTGLSAQLHLDSLGFGEKAIYQQTSPFNCGTIALAHACHCIGLDGILDDSALKELHLFLSSWSTQNSGLHAFGPPGSTQLINDLADLLHQRGVPGEVSRDRAIQAIDRLGYSFIRESMASKHPWAAIKAEANKPQHMFRLVYPLELSQYIRQEGRLKFGAKVTTDKKRKKPAFDPRAPPSPLRVDPAELELLPNTFFDAKKAVVPSIDFDTVTAGGRGIALCTIDQAEHFVKAAKHISVDALALAIAELPDEEVAKSAGIQKAFIPAEHKGTGEPLLLVGGIFQLGDTLVERQKRENIDSSDLVSTAVLKLQVFRDSIDHWASFIQSPIKDTISQVPALQLCRSPGCSSGTLATCQFTHPAVDEDFEQVIMDVWARNFTSIDGKKCDAAGAEVFIAFLRIPSTAITQILSQQPAGFFFEPRLEASRGPDPSYRIVWLPGHDLQAATAKARSSIKVLGLMRMKQRYGVRVHQRDEASVFAELRPDTPFQDVSIKQTYQLFPLPFGTTKQSVASLLSKWGWSARPLHAGRGDKTAISWIVGATDPPPQLVLPGYKMEVLITEVKSQQKPPSEEKVVASKKTQEIIRKGSTLPKAGQDPWLHAEQDPWKAFKPTSSASSSSATPAVQQTRTHYDQLAKDLKASLKEDIRNEVNVLQSTPATGDYEQRISNLESGMHELHQQNASFANWFTEMGTKYQALQGTVTEIQTHSQAQSQEIQNLGNEVRTTQTYLQNALVSSIKEVKVELGSELSKRFDTFEAMLSKKTRMED